MHASKSGGWLFTKGGMAALSMEGLQEDWHQMEGLQEDRCCTEDELQESQYLLRVKISGSYNLVALCT